MHVSDDQLYFRQLLGGREFAAGDGVAAQMANFAYAIGDRATGEALLVDPAWDVADLVAAVRADGMTPAGVLVTHFHADHVGGSLMGHQVQGLAELLANTSIPVHANDHEVDLIRRATGVSASELVGHPGGAEVVVGDVAVTLLHTPGHTPGSQCFLVDGRLVAGDTLFLEGCGRTDLPGSDPGAMYDSLQRLATLPASTMVFPGHDYSPPATSAGLGELTSANFVFRPPSKAAWLTMFAGG